MPVVLTPACVNNLMQAFVGRSYKRWADLGIRYTMCDFTEGPVTTAL